MSELVIAFLLSFRIFLFFLGKKTTTLRICVLAEYAERFVENVEILLEDVHVFLVCLDLSIPLVQQRLKLLHV